MSLLGGDHALIVNATNTCANPQVATAKFVGQNNANRNLRVPMKVKCPKKKKAKGKKAAAKPAKAKGGGK
jgi:hypothetical protein